MKNLNLQNIKDFLYKTFQFIIKNFKNIFLICLILYIFYLGSSYLNVKDNLYNTTLNYEASIDSLRITKNKLGDLVYSKKIYIKSIDELKKENNSLYKEIDKLKYSEKKNLIEISKLSVSLNHLKDSINQTYDSSYKELNQYKYNFELSDKYRTLEGYTIVHSQCIPDSSFFYLEKDSIYVDFVITKKEINSGIELGVSTDNPYVKVNDIQGSIVNIDKFEKYQKQKKWGLGVGIGISSGYDLLNKSIFIGPSIQFSINYNLLTW